MKSLFISYSWSNADISDLLDAKLYAKGIKIIRDKNCLGYRDNIEQFMKNIKHTDFALILFSKSYLTSQNCMYEVIELFKLDDYKSKVIPVILNDTDIFSNDSRLDYAIYWKEEYKKISKKLNTLDIEQQNMEDLKIITSIKNNILDFLTEIKKMNCLTISDNNVDDIVDEIYKIINPKPEKNVFQRLVDQKKEVEEEKKMLVLGIGEAATFILQPLENETKNLDIVSFTEEKIDYNGNITHYMEGLYGIPERKELTDKIKKAELIFFAIDNTADFSVVNEVKNLILKNNKDIPVLGTVIEPFKVTGINNFSWNEDKNINNLTCGSVFTISENKLANMEKIEYVRNITPIIGEEISHFITELDKVIFGDESNNIISVDLDDIKTVLKDKRRAVFFCKKYRTNMDYEPILERDLGKYKNLFGRKEFESVLYNIEGGRQLSILEMSRVSSVFSQHISKEAYHIMGSRIDESISEDTIVVTAICV